MEGFKYKHKYDLIICFFDSLNYILNDKGIIKTFKNVSEHLNNKGVFVFDINSSDSYKNNIYQHSKKLIGNEYKIEYRWKGYYNAIDRIYSINMRYKGYYSNERLSFRENHYQRSYNIEEMSELIKRGGMNIIGIFNAYSFDCVKSDSERHVYITNN